MFHRISDNIDISFYPLTDNSAVVACVASDFLSTTSTFLFVFVFSSLPQLCTSPGAGENSPAQSAPAETAAQKRKSSSSSFAAQAWKRCMAETASWVSWLCLLLPGVECATIVTALSHPQSPSYHPAPFFSFFFF